MAPTPQNVAGPIDVLIVDDSAVVRRLVRRVLERDPDVTVSRTASDGAQALRAIEAKLPDIVLLDVEMPVMNGMEALRAIRRQWPKLPVVMFSTLTRRGSTQTIEALAAGATDYAHKPSNSSSLQDGISVVHDDVLPKLKAIVQSTRPVPRRPRPTPIRPRPARVGTMPSIVAVGSSTGGPRALECVFSSFAEPLPVAVVVVQHMPPVFTELLANRLDSKSVFHVFEAQDGQVLRPGQVAIAPGGRHLEVRNQGGEFVTVLHDGPQENSCRPAVDVLFRSVATAARGRALGVVLTGMGRDGAAGAEALVAAGAEVLTQDADSCVVYGMPRAVVEAGAATDVVTLEDMGRAIQARCNARSRRMALAGGSR